MTGTATPAGPAPRSDRVGVAAFDFDGTLVPGDSLLPFLRLLAGGRRVGRTFLLSGPSLVRTFCSGGGRDATKAVLLGHLLTGWPAEAVAGAGERYAARLERRIQPAMGERIGWHRSQDHRLVLVSASLEVYLEPLGRRLGFDAVLATGLEIGDDGALTGRLQGANVRGSEKERRLRSWLTGELAGRPWELWAYGDSTGDRELLAMADHPVRL